MNEFEERDYQSARDCADAVKTNADNILSIFDNIDHHMKILYGDAWQSTGADATSERYQEIRKNYEIFYNNVITMRDHIYNVTDINEEADASVSSSISNI